MAAAICSSLSCSSMLSSLWSPLRRTCSWNPSIAVCVRVCVNIKPMYPRGFKEKEKKRTLIQKILLLLGLLAAPHALLDAVFDLFERRLVFLLFFAPALLRLGLGAPGNLVKKTGVLVLGLLGRAVFLVAREVLLQARQDALAVAPVARDLRELGAEAGFFRGEGGGFGPVLGGVVGVGELF